MPDHRLKHWASAVTLVLTATATGCADEDPDDIVPTKADGAFDLEVVDHEACEAAGYQELIDFFADNDIEVQNEEVNGEYPYCKIEMIWAVSSDGENENEATLHFDLRVFDSIVEAQRVIDEPEKLHMVSHEFREVTDGQVESVPEPWDGGFIWSTLDTSPGAETEVAVRKANIVVYVDFDYATLDAPQCEEEGCVVFPSALVSWIQGTYLPVVEQNVNDLIGL